MKQTVVLLVFLSAGWGCKSKAPDSTQAEKVETRSVTHWTGITELFMEYPPLIVGEKGRYAVHLTHLSTFKPLNTGEVEVRLEASDGTVESFRTAGPSRPGIFGVDVKPTKAGTAILSVVVRSQALQDTHRLGEVRISMTAKAVEMPDDKPEEETISFLKEQQWTLDFGTALVEERVQRDSLRVPAEVMPRSGGEAQVTTPFAGRLVGSAPPPLGTRVEKGQALIALLPPTASANDLPALELYRVETQAALQLAQKDRERAERLLAAGAVPERRLDEARTAETTAGARLKAARARLQQYETTRSADGSGFEERTFSLRAPISGVVAETHATPGANVTAGAVIFTIIDTDTVYVAGHVPEASLSRLQQLAGAELEVSGSTHPVARLISRGQLVNSATRTVDVTYEVDNRARLFAVGQAVSLHLFTSARAKAPAVPDSAVIDDAGRPIVFVQKQGEAFARRPVTVGVREGGYVEVLEGVKPGERVVTRGAYLIRLASLSSQAPAHGHVH